MLLARDVDLHDSDVLWLRILSLAVWTLVAAMTCSFPALFDASLVVAVVGVFLK